MRHPHQLIAARPRRRGALPALVLVAGLVVAACSSGIAGPATLPSRSIVPPASAGPAIAPAVPAVPTTHPPSDPPTTVRVSTVPVSLYSASPIDSTTVLSDEGPWTRVDRAPGVATAGLFYELLPQVWVYLPLAEDLANGIVWTLRDDTRPIIEGYLTAQAARLPVGANVVLRPQVLGDDRTDTAALVADCVTAVGDATRTGWGASLAMRDGAWVVVAQAPREDACWFG
jgi:hypothetical protein